MPLQGALRLSGSPQVYDRCTYEHLLHLSVAVTSCQMAPSYTAPELLERPRHQRCTVGPSPFVLCSVAGVSKLCVTCLREILCPAHLFCKGL